MASTRCACPARSRSAAGFGFTDGLARSRTCRAAASRPPSTSPSRWRAPRSLPASPVPSTATTPEPPPCGESSTTKTMRRSGDTVREFVRREVVPHQDAWDNIGHIDPSLWVTAGNQGLLGLDFPEQYGGGGVDDLVGPYLVDLGTDDQRIRWLPGLASGETTGALAI